MVYLKLEIKKAGGKTWRGSKEKDTILVSFYFCDTWQDLVAIFFFSFEDVSRT